MCGGVGVGARLIKNLDKQEKNKIMKCLTLQKKWRAKPPPPVPTRMLTNGLNNLQKLNTCRLCGWRRKSSSMKAIRKLVMGLRMILVGFGF